MGHLVIQTAFEAFNKDCVITSGDELTSKHTKGSLHPTGNAIDYRSWVFGTEDEKVGFALRVNTEFNYNPDYEFYYEPTLKDEAGNVTRTEHFHYEFQRKGL